MHINGATAPVPEANRGLGKRLVEQLVERGTAKVCGAARRPETVTTPAVTAIHLDITDPSSVAGFAVVLDTCGKIRAARHYRPSTDPTGLLSDDVPAAVGCPGWIDRRTIQVRRKRWQRSAQSGWHGRRSARGWRSRPLPARG